MNTWRPYQLGNQVCLSGILFSWKLLNWMVLLEFGWFCFWISLSFFLFFFNGFLGFLAVEVLDMEIMEFYGCDAEMMIWCLRLWFIFWGGKGYIIINAWWPSISFDIVCFVLCVCVCVCVYEHWYVLCCFCYLNGWLISEDFWNMNWLFWVYSWWCLYEMLLFKPAFEYISGGMQFSIVFIYWILV